VTHYEVLGVGVRASAREIRASYVARARRTHPDYYGEADAPTRAAREAEMRRLNEAWTVLGDPARRASYDLTLAEGATQAPPTTGEPGFRPTGGPDPEFVPYDDSDDVDYAALLDDRPVGNGARLPRALQVAPAALLVAAVFSLSAAAVTSLPALVAFGLACLVLSGACFVLVPMLAVMRSLESDRDGR
jgi:hypothetical protein